jgi:hypothetical protein
MTAPKKKRFIYEVNSKPVKESIMSNQCKAWVLASLLMLLPLGVGCGGGAKVQTTTSTQTLGQEMIDLDKAYAQGIINKKEYERAKKGLIKMYK